MDWEYRLIEVKTKGFFTSRLPDGASERLDDLGRKGFDLVQTIPLRRSFGRTDAVVFVLRRERG